MIDDEKKINKIIKNWSIYTFKDCPVDAPLPVQCVHIVTMHHRLYTCTNKVCMTVALSVMVCVHGHFEAKSHQNWGEMS